MELYIIKYIILIQIVLFIIGWMIAFKRPVNHRFKRMLPRPIKASISFLMSFTALIVLMNSNSYVYKYSMFVFIGMIFSSFADLIMCRLIRTKNNLLGGMIVFSLAHINYTLAYINMIISENKFNVNYIIMSLMLFCLIVYLGYKTIIKKYEKENITKFGAIIYGAIIINMFMFSVLLFVNVGGVFKYTFISAIIFMMSDLIIALTDILKHNFELEGIAVWLTYITAQMGIICAPIIDKLIK